VQAPDLFELFISPLDRIDVQYMVTLTAWAMVHRRPLETPRGVIWTAPPEYVIVLKLRYWHEGGSDKHRHDSRSMVRVLGDAVDRPFIEREAERRGLTREWAQVEASW
jgi:hypothetical protein